MWAQQVLLCAKIQVGIFHLPWHHKGLCPPSGGDHWLGWWSLWWWLLSSFSTVFSRWAEVTLYLLVSETFSHSEKKWGSLCFIPGRLVLDSWNFVFKRFLLVSSQMSRSWRGHRYLLAFEFMNHQPQESLFVAFCWLVYNYFSPKYQDDSCVKPKRQSLSAFTRGSRVCSWIFNNGDHFCKYAKVL